MQVVILSGGKQYQVTPGQILKVEKLAHDVGDQVAFNEVLLITEDENVQLGSPLIAGVKVSAEVVSQGRHKKVHIVKMRRRKHYMRHQGHRQYFTEVKITGIERG